MIFMAGRTPITEDRTAAEGARTVYVHWAQEMYDQGAMVREMVKWDYELRAPDEVDKVIDDLTTRIGVQHDASDHKTSAPAGVGRC